MLTTGFHGILRSGWQGTRQEIKVCIEDIYADRHK